MALPETRPSLVVGPRLPTPTSRFPLYTAVAATTATASTYLAFLSVTALPDEDLSVVLITAAPVCGALALPVVLSRGRAENNPGLTWLASGLGVSVFAMLLQLISFPTIAANGGPLGTDGQGSAHLYLFFHLVLAAGALLGAFGAAQRWQPVFVGVGLLVALVAALNLVPSPMLLGPEQHFTPFLTTLQSLTAAVLAAAFLAWLRRAGSHASSLQGWIGLALLLLTYETVLNALSTMRFDSVWWASLSLRTASFAGLAGGLIWSSMQQMRRFEGYSDLELSRREAQLHQSVAVTDALLTNATNLSRVVAPEEVAGVLAESICALTGLGSQVEVCDLSPDGRRLRRLHPVPVTTEQATPDAIDQDIPAGKTVTDEAAMFLAKRAQVAKAFPHWAAGPTGRDVRSLVTLPLSVGGRTIGAVTVTSDSDREWTSLDRELLIGVGSQGGAALSRSRLYERERGFAEALQRALLPERLPIRPDVDMAARYLPGQQGSQVGGDWYDCIEVSSSKVAIVVGDVMGKGVEAATVMGRLRDAARVLAEIDPSPAAVLDGLNHVLLTSDSERIATAVYMLLDSRNSALELACAGHLPPLMVTPSGRAEYLDGGRSPLLGLASDDRCQARIQAEPGSMLVLYTDGLVEDATGTDEGLSELKSAAVGVIREHGHDADAFAEALISAMSGRPRVDDIALLVARII